MTDSTVQQNLTLAERLKTPKEGRSFCFDSGNCNLVVLLALFGMQEKRKFTKRLELARSKELSHLELVYLANDPHPKIRLRLAQRSDTPSDILALLWNDPAENVRIFVAKHPNVLPETLARMAPDLSHRVATEIARRNETPFMALEIIARNADENVRRTLATNHKVPRYILMQMADSETSLRVIYKILKRRDLPENLFLKLTENPNKAIRRSAYSRLKPTREYIEQMARDTCYYIRARAAKSPLISEASLKRLLNDDQSYVRSYAVDNPIISTSQLGILSNDPDYGPRMAVAKHPRVTKEMLTRLSFDESDFVRRTVAENEKTPLDVLKTFVIDPSSYVRSNVVSNKAIPKAWLRKNFPEQFLDNHIKAVLDRPEEPSDYERAMNPLTPVKDLKALSLWQCDLDALREEPYTYNEDLLHQAAFRQEEAILSGLLRNPSLPSKMLIQICSRLLEAEKQNGAHIYSLLHSAVIHPASNHELMDFMLEHVDKKIGVVSYSNHLRVTIARNPVTLPRTLRRLAETSGHFIRSSIARNPATPIDTLRKLAVDPSFYVKFGVLQRATVPKEIGQILTNDPIMAEMYQERLSGGYIWKPRMKGS